MAALHGDLAGPQTWPIHHTHKYSKLTKTAQNIIVLNFEDRVDITPD